MSQPRLYADLSEMWRFISPPEHYVEEVASFVARFRRHGVPDGGRILHLGSGGGSIDFHLKRHYELTGLDVSPSMVAYAGRLNPEVEYVEGDIRTARLGREFDGVLLHDAISYMTTEAELERAYRTAAAHLRPGGVMVTIPEQLREAKSRPGQTSIETVASGGRTVTLFETDHDEDPSDNRMEVLYVFVIREGGETKVEADLHVNGVFALAEFMAAMDRAGFDAAAEPWELTDWAPGEEVPLIVAVKR
jgi:SAM-dependent methyltransferase